MTTPKFAAACLAAALLTLPAFAAGSPARPPVDALALLQEAVLLSETLATKLEQQKAGTPVSLFEASRGEAQAFPMTFEEIQLDLALREGALFLDVGRRQLERSRSSKSRELARITLDRSVKAYKKAAAMLDGKEGD